MASGRVKRKWHSDFAPETCHSSVLRHKILERTVKDGLWPSPGTCEGQLYGSSFAALTYASSATLENYCACAAELQTRSRRSATRQVEVPVTHARRPATHTQPYQTAIALAAGLIEPPEPADTILAPAPQPRCGAAGACRAPKSRLGRRSAWPHR